MPDWYGARGMSNETSIKLSTEQQEAVSRNEKLIVRAGAGSGKTEVLARRFVALLAGDLGEGEPLAPAQLAALTFTEKAALDMRERITSVLAERIRATTDESLRLHLRRAERTLGLARISTIHAFCARVLRENAVAAGLDPDFEVLDDYESIIFYERVCREVLVKAVRDGDKGALALVQARRLESASPRESAQEIVRRILTEARRQGDSPEKIQQRTERYANRFEDTNDRVAPLAKQFADVIDNLVRVDNTTGTTKKKILALREVWRGAGRQVRDLNRWSTSADIELLRKILAEVPTAQSPKVRDFVNAAKESAEIDKVKKYGLTGDLIATWGEYRGIEVARPVAQLIARTGEAIEKAERNYHVMTFDGLLVVVRNLFRQNPRVVSRYRRELTAILVDEYQDTNNVQDEIIRLLTDPEVSNDAVAPQLFIVGDEKQSIYRFRGADVSVFNRSRDAAEVGLTENRRSTRNILNFANGVAEIAMANPPEPRDYRTVWSDKHKLKASRPVAIDYPVEFIPKIEDDAGSNEKSDSSDRRGREGLILGRCIRQIVESGEPIIDPDNGSERLARYRDCVILMRAFGDIGIYEQAVAAVGVPTYTVKGRGFYGRPEVKDLITLLQAIADPRDSLAIATVLRSPFFALSDDCLLEMGLYLRRAPKGDVSIAALFEKGDFSWLAVERAETEAAADILHQLRAMRDRQPAHVIVERSLELTDYESVMAGLPKGDQRIANLRKVMEIARSFDTHRFFTFRDFVSYLTRLVEEEPYEPQAQIPGEDDDVVRLMTVHQAKGLEFPIVVIADAGRRPPSNSATPLLDPENGLLMCATDGSGYDEIPNAAVKRYRDRLKDEEEAESARILYVALTRARDRLIISEGPTKDGWSKYLRGFIGNEALAAPATKETLRTAENGAQILIRPPVTVDLSAGLPRAADYTASDAETPIHPAPPARFVSVGERVISPTALADFDRCPRQYWLRHGLRLPELYPGENGGEAGALAMGSVAHEVLERIQFGLDGEPARTGIAQLAQVIGARAGLSERQCEEIAQDLESYARMVDHHEQILGREIPFMLNAAPGLFIRGQIDLVLRTREGIVVRDYKYASKSDAARYQIQLECYALAVAENFPTDQLAAQIATLRGEPSLIELALASVSAIRSKLAALGEHLAEAARMSVYPKKPKNEGICKGLRCGYIDRCWKSS